MAIRSEGSTLASVAPPAAMLRATWRPRSAPGWPASPMIRISSPMNGIDSKGFCGSPSVGSSPLMGAWYEGARSIAQAAAAAPRPQTGQAGGG